MKDPVGEKSVAAGKCKVVKVYLTFKKKVKLLIFKVNILAGFKNYTILQLN